MLFILVWLLALLVALEVRFTAAQDSSNTTLCGHSDYYNSSALPFSFNNNQWGDDGSGYSCINIYDQDQAASFTVSYKWDGDASVVKGFPYIQADPSNLPVPLQDVVALEVKGNWDIYLQGQGNDSGLEEAEGFDKFAVKTNVAIDMFLSDDAANSTSDTPPIEVMIWPWYVSDIFPLGYTTAMTGVPTVEVEGIKYRLFNGWNAQNQHVFSWLAEKNLTSVDADFSPLLKYLYEKQMLSGTLWLGQLELGTELMHAAADTVFNATIDTLRIVRQGDADAANATSFGSSPPTAAPTSSRASSTSASQTATITSQASPVSTSTGSASASAPVSLAGGSWLSASFWVALAFIGFGL